MQSSGDKPARGEAVTGSSDPVHWRQACFERGGLWGLRFSPLETLTCPGERWKRNRLSGVVNWSVYACVCVTMCVNDCVRVCALVCLSLCLYGFACLYGSVYGCLYFSAEPPIITRVLLVQTGRLVAQLVRAVRCCSSCCSSCCSCCCCCCHLTVSNLQRAETGAAGAVAYQIAAHKRWPRTDRL